MSALFTVRQRTGTLAQLREAFGVQIAEGTIYARMRNKHWDIEKALLFSYSKRQAPTRLDNPLPIPEPGPKNHWLHSKEELERRLGCRIDEALMVMVAMGMTSDEIKTAHGVRVSSLHYQSLLRRVEKIRKETASTHDSKRVKDMYRTWRMRHFYRRKGYGNQFVK